MKRHVTLSSFQLLVWVARLGVFGLVVSVVVAVDTALTDQHRIDVRQTWQARVDEVSLGLQAEILQNVQTVWGLAANVSVEPEMDEDRFRELASIIFRLAPALKNIGLAPDLTIQHVYPMRGNEAAIGLDLTESSLSPNQIRTLQQTRGALFSGPINLVQGGKGLASRIPIFTADTDQFWGVVSVIIDLNRLYDIVDFVEVRRELRFVLSASENIENADAIFYGPRNDAWTDPVSSILTMPGTTWTLFAEPAAGWPTAPENPWAVRGILFLVSATIVVAVFWLTNLMLRDREMQIRFWGLFELAPIGVGLFHAESGRLMRANREFASRFGRQGNTLDFFEHGFEADGAPIETSLDLRKSLRREGRLDDLQTYYPVEDGSVSPVKIRGLQLSNAGNDPVVWLIVEDISEQKKVEQMKNEFISTVSHELRTPLTSISGSLGLLANNATGSLPESMAKMVHIAHRNSLQLTHLINDLLDIDKLVAGKMRFQMTLFAIDEWVADTVENIGQYAGEQKVRFNVSPLHEVQAYADRQRLSQALNNLLSNAIKFSPIGGTVHVFSQLRYGRVYLCVRDEGPGVPPEFHQRIFEKFSQADGSSRRSKGGTGLGLAITRELMKQMGGSVDYVSTPGEGATFWLEIPITENKKPGEQTHRVS